MPNQLDGSGLQVDSVSEITANITAALQGIYGTDINVDSNSPDGQMIGIFSQACADILELLVDVYNSFAIESAFGVDLDQRVALNGMTRQAGTYTETPVLVTVTQALTLTGLDALVANPLAQVFTVQDNNGNQWLLLATHSFGGAGSATLTFRAAVIGAKEVTANTITSQVTVVLGVTSVNNPTTSGTVPGVNEESDAQLKIRHDKMFYLAAIGPADSIGAALLSIPDVSDAYVVENVTSSPVDTVPAHGIWCIVTGGTDAEIAQAIYSKKAPGCDMKGTTTFDIVRPQGNVFTAKWDASIAEDLFIQFAIVPRVGSVTFDNAAIKQALVDALTYKLGQIATIGDVVAAMLVIAPQGYLTGVGVSDDGVTYTDSVEPTTAQYYFTLNTANINIL